MKKVNLKQGTRAWENARATRIGSSEVFDIVRYYATDTELQNCGLNAEEVREETPYVTAWGLYHKVLNDGLFQQKLLDASYAEYGHAVEPYGRAILQEGRQFRLRAGEVFMSKSMIASLDISGVSESIDERPFDYGEGNVEIGKRFVCEQKTIFPTRLEKGLPIKHVIQAQYQIDMSRKDFFILQVMVLENDTEFERGKIVAEAKRGVGRLKEYLADKISVSHIYFADNKRLSALIQTCLRRFFKDVRNRHEPTPFLECDSQKNIIASLRANSFYNPSMEVEFNLTDYILAKEYAEGYEKLRKQILQNIIAHGMSKNASKFKCKSGYTASFTTDGKFLVKEPKEVSNGSKAT